MTDIMKLADDYAECMYLRREKHEARAALQSAIEALTVERDALQAKLDAIQKQEPRFWYDEDIGELYASANNHFVDRWTALYAAPKALEPLTDDLKRAMWIAATIELPSQENCYLRGIADAERKHGIGGTP